MIASSVLWLVTFFVSWRNQSNVTYAFLLVDANMEALGASDSLVKQAF